MFLEDISDFGGDSELRAVFTVVHFENWRCEYAHKTVIGKSLVSIEPLYFNRADFRTLKNFSITGTLKGVFIGYGLISLIKIKGDAAWLCKHVPLKFIILMRHKSTIVPAYLQMK